MKNIIFSWHPPCTAWFWLTKSLFVFSIWYHLDLTPWVLLPRRPTPTSPSPRPRLRPPCVSRRASSRPWGTGHRSSWVRGSQWNILLQINSFPCCTWLRFRRLAALLDYNIWKDRWRAKSKHWGYSGVNWLIACAVEEYAGVCVCVPGGGSSSMGGGARDLFGSRSSKSFITWLVLSLLFLRFFSSSRA